MAVPPGAEAPKAEWRSWARTLPPVTDDLARRVLASLRGAIAELDGPVLGYVAMPGEVPIEGLVPAGVLALPRIGDDGPMSVHLDEGNRERHRLGVEQPPAGLPIVDPATLAAVLVPGLVFDRDGFRLGRGGGHYDRLVPQLTPGTSVIGVACESRIVPRLPREPHDQPMTHLATEHGVFSTK